MRPTEITENYLNNLVRRLRAKENDYYQNIMVSNRLDCWTTKSPFDDAEMSSIKAQIACFQPFFQHFAIPIPVTLFGSPIPPLSTDQLVEVGNLRENSMYYLSDGAAGVDGTFTGHTFIFRPTTDKFSPTLTPSAAIHTTPIVVRKRPQEKPLLEIVEIKREKVDSDDEKNNNEINAVLMEMAHRYVKRTVTIDEKPLEIVEIKKEKIDSDDDEENNNEISAVLMEMARRNVKRERFNVDDEDSTQKKMKETFNECGADSDCGETLNAVMKRGRIHNHNDLRDDGIFKELQTEEIKI